MTTAPSSRRYVGGARRWVASQGVAVMMGLQDEIDFGRVAMAGVGSAVG